MDLSHTKVAYEFCMGLRFSALEIPTLKSMGRGRRRGGGGGGARNGTDRVFVFKTLMNRSFKLV